MKRKGLSAILLGKYVTLNIVVIIKTLHMGDNVLIIKEMVSNPRNVFPLVLVNLKRPSHG